MTTGYNVRYKKITALIDWGRLILLHLLPGALIVVAYTLIVRSVAAYGYPRVLALGIASILVMAPTQLGYVYYQSKKTYNRLSLKEIIPYRSSLPLKNYFLYSVLLFLWAGVTFTLLGPVNEYLLNNWFHWLPEWFLLTEDYSVFSKSSLLVAFLSSLVLTGIIAPVVEEIYFRGYLLPRMEWVGKYSVLVHSILFAVYHFWSPWQVITRVIAILPMIYIVKRERNVYVGIIVHCIINIVGDAAFLLSLLLK